MAEIRGEAIYKTRPWKTAEGKTTDDIEVRFTRKPDALYAILLQKPAGNNVTIKSLIVAPKTKIRLLGSKQTITWQQHETDLLIHLPEEISPPSTHTPLKSLLPPINAHLNDH